MFPQYWLGFYQRENKKHLRQCTLIPVYHAIYQKKKVVIVLSAQGKGGLIKTGDEFSVTSILAQIIRAIV